MLRLKQEKNNTKYANGYTRVVHVMYLVNWYTLHVGLVVQYMYMYYIHTCIMYIIQTWLLVTGYMYTRYW